MTFLVASLLIIISTLAHLAAEWSIAPRSVKVARVLIIVLWNATMICAFSLLDGRGVAGDATNWTPWAVLVLGCAVTGFNVGLVVGERRSGNPPSARLGWNVLTGMAGLYMVIAAFTHFWFFRGEHAGFAALSYITDGKIACPMALVRIDDEVAEYRCPTRVMFNRLYAQPFAPWPSYAEGESAEVKADIERLHKEAAAP